MCLFSLLEARLVDERKQKIAKMGDSSIKFWLGWQDSNLRMTGPKPVALPLGDSLILLHSTTKPSYRKPQTKLAPIPLALTPKLCYI